MVFDLDGGCTQGSVRSSSGDLELATSLPLAYESWVETKEEIGWRSSIPRGLHQDSGSSRDKVIIMTSMPITLIVNRRTVPSLSCRRQASTANCVVDLMQARTGLVAMVMRFAFEMHVGELYDRWGANNKYKLT